MIDQKRASGAARQGFDLWIDGKPEQAVPLYEEALQFADPTHYGLPDYHGEFAGVLNMLGRHGEALVQLQQAIAVQLRADPDGQWLLLWVRALAYLALGRDTEADAELAKSMRNAPSDEKRNELASLFAEEKNTAA